MSSGMTQKRQAPRDTLWRFAATVNDRRRWPSGADRRWMAVALRARMLERGMNERMLSEAVARIFHHAIPAHKHEDILPTRAKNGQISAWLWGKVRPREAVAIALAAALQCESLEQVIHLDELDAGDRPGDAYVRLRYPHYVEELDGLRARLLRR